MSIRFATRLLPALVLGALAWTTPAAAQGRYDHDDDHYLRDRYEAQQHRWQDRGESLGHAIGDFFRYGTTDPYSSPGHYYRDRQREVDHYFRDRDRTLDHYDRDRWNSRRSGGYDGRNDSYYRNDQYRHGYDRNDDYRFRDSSDHHR